jgi:predicted ester cyclase
LPAGDPAILLAIPSARDYDLRQPAKPPASRVTLHEGGITVMTTITDTARAFFEACETGKGWDGCKAYCTPDATFSAQCEALDGITTLQAYADWMTGLLGILPDGSYQLKSFATDNQRNNVAAYGIFTGTHTGEGGPVEPTGKTVNADYVYVMQFTGDKITHMTKIWHSWNSLKELGWAA